MSVFGIAGDGAGVVVDSAQFRGRDFPLLVPSALQVSLHLGRAVHRDGCRGRHFFQVRNSCGHVAGIESVTATSSRAWLFWLDPANTIPVRISSAGTSCPRPRRLSAAVRKSSPGLRLRALLQPQHTPRPAGCAWQHSPDRFPGSSGRSRTAVHHLLAEESFVTWNTGARASLRRTCRV